MPNTVAESIAAQTVPLFRWTKYDADRNRPAMFRAERVRRSDATAQPHAPMPTRPVPHMIFEAHGVHPSQEVDWTLDRDQGVEQSNCDMRNSMIKDMLQSGRSVQYRSTGNSLNPLVVSGDVTMWEPVKDHSQLVVGDVVFCCVQEGDRYFGHAIHSIVKDSGETYWWIGNLKTPPRINGWCGKEHIFGQLYEVSEVQPGRCS